MSTHGPEDSPAGEQSGVPGALPPGIDTAEPVTADDPPRIDEFWIDARLDSAPGGVAYLAHPAEGDDPVLVVLLSEGAADDLAARERFAGRIDDLHIDDVLARGGRGQDTGRLARRFRPEQAPIPGGEPIAPWAALSLAGGAATVDLVRDVLDDVSLAMLPQQGSPSGPDYRLHWSDRAEPGRSRLWPATWPGRRDRAGWVSILVSWLLMLLLAALAVLIAIWIFHDDPPQVPPTPTGQSGSPSEGGGSGSPSPQSASPSDGSGSPSQSPSQSDSASPSPSDGSGSPSQTPSMSGSPSPSGSESGGGEPSDSGQPGSPTPTSRL